MPVSRTSTLVLSVLLSVFLVQQSFAQYGPPGGGGPPPQTIYEIDWNERLAPNIGLRAHDENLLGDNIDLHTGRLSFEHVDVSIPGNSHLPVEIRRRLNPSQSGLDGGFSSNEFGDWQLATPMISTKILFTEYYNAKFYDGQAWGKNRCTQPLKNAIPPAMYAMNHLGATTPTYPEQYSDGVLIDIPGRVSGQILDKTGASAWPSQADKVTASGWYLTCIINIDGNGTEGFMAHAPNGDTYRFDVIRAKPYVARNDF